MACERGVVAPLAELGGHGLRAIAAARTSEAARAEVAALRADALAAAFDAEAAPEPRVHERGIGTGLAVGWERLEAFSLEAAPLCDGIAAP
jgi:hypothetical protein